MPLQLHEVLHEDEFQEMIECECESYQTPLNTLFRLFRYDESPAGFSELLRRQVRSHSNDPTSRWFKIVDTDLGDKLVGAANWNTFTENPYGDESTRVVNANWWPEGEPREFANLLLGCLMRQRWQKMSKPHMPLAWLFVHPTHRRRGVARQLMDWGMAEADRLGLEIFLEASEDGRPCYEACGFKCLGTNSWAAEKEDKSEKWRELEGFFQTPIATHLMWRGVDGA